MTRAQAIPIFNLFGETSDFPDVIHYERIRDRALGHDWHIGTHRHADMVQLLYMERGLANVRIDGKEFALNDQELLYVPAQAVHEFKFRQGAEGGVFSFPLTLIAGLPSAAGELAAQLTVAARVSADPALQDLLATLVRSFRSSGTFRASLLASLGQAVLIAIAEAGFSQQAGQMPLARRRMAGFDQLLRADLDAGKTAANYAQQLGITPGHLNRICRAATGSSSGSYIEAARMVEASRLLAFTRLSVAEVGFRLGYEDPPYFSRRFRNVTGTTPSAYRARFSQ
ncbi:helix-turn-helix domain-containing protein [Pseudogemmobacter faecipullorum]|uniref:Helix-turn-helix domain-containing protein n=1 Tax=Pseudogemmobacter faecipullorum TaxID=2755041 RepID=A0ABS8CRM8_9RHOB|nr:helix-turn-helix domain-containing protein [Pseudogemmobacter faecipullorum]MCB5412038.1 helix-turn-helix domain-containing protein [Pseudogemmobacter faecipullorum]